MRSTTAMLSLLFVALLHAQGPISLSLQQALDLAARQSYMVQSSALEAEKSVQRSKEITAVGLPQVNGSAQLQNFINVPTQLIPNFFSAPGQGPEYVPVQFGVPWSMNAGLTLNQLIFDGSYLVGLKAAKELRVQGQQAYEKAQADARNQAAKAYFGVLAAEEGSRLIGESIPLLEKSMTEVTATFNAGFLEQTDLDRISIQLEQAKAQQRSFVQQANVARMLLALALGVPQGTPITLTDGLQAILDNPVETSLSEQELTTASHIEMQQANTIVDLSVLENKNDKVKALPTLAGFLQHQQVWNGPKFDPGGLYNFYPTTLWGLQLNVPIFSSGSRYHKAAQTKLAIEQAKINQTATEQRLITMTEQSRSQARTAMDNLKTEQSNMDLSKKILDRTTLKFNTGSSTSFEYTQEQGNYLVAQQLYIQRMVELLMARADLRKALDLY